MPISGASYDRELISLMEEALELAWAEVANIAELAPSADETAIRSLMTTRLMAGIEEHIRDLSVLKTLALNAIDWYALVAADNPTIPPKQV